MIRTAAITVAALALTAGGFFSSVAPDTQLADSAIARLLALGFAPDAAPCCIDRASGWTPAPAGRRTLTTAPAHRFGASAILGLAPL